MARARIAEKHDRAHVVFDLDGTLVDTAPDLIDTLNVMLARDGLAPLDYADARKMIGAGARRLIESALELEGRPMSGERSSRCSRISSPITPSHIADRSRAFPGLEPALDRLAARGCRLRGLHQQARRRCRGFCSMRSS